MHCQLVIVGSGPAGYTAAIYAARAGLQPVMFTGILPGGQLMTTGEVENFPGYPSGVEGPQLMEDVRQQAIRFGTKINYGLITAVDFSRRPFLLKADDSLAISADVVILATGAQAKWLGLDSEKKFYGKGVSACAICDGFFYKDRTVAIAGGGDSACEEALHLANICPKVYLIVRKNTLKASYIMQQRVVNHPRIEVLWNKQVEEVLGAEVVETIHLKDSLSGEISTLPVSALFVAIGHKPNSEVFKSFIQTDADGYVLTKTGSTHTSLAGVFACGDLQDKHYRQAITAAATGAMAALDAERYLSTLQQPSLQPVYNSYAL